MKTQKEAIKKTQTKGILGMKKLSKWTGTLKRSITNKIQEIEEIISGFEDPIEEREERSYRGKVKKLN